jgi:hypothetical protein
MAKAKAKRIVQRETVLLGKGDKLSDMVTQVTYSDGTVEHVPVGEGSKLPLMAKAMEALDAKALATARSRSGRRRRS